MKQKETIYCNICQKPSTEDQNTVYLSAFKNGEEVHICTSCIPHVIHGSGEIVKSNEEVKKEI